MGDPINRYFRGRPFAGSGRADDYFRPAPDLSYLGDDENGGYPLPEEGGYAVSEIPVQRLPQDRRERGFVARNIARQEGPIPSWMLSQLKQEQGIEAPDETHAQRRRSDAAWAMHYLNKADPQSPDFSNGLTRMFQQFPGAAQDPKVLGQVAQIRNLNPVSKVHPETQALYKAISSIPKDAPDYPDQVQKAISSAGEAAFDPRLSTWLNGVTQYADTVRIRNREKAERNEAENVKMIANIKGDRSAFPYFNHLSKQGGMNPTEAARKTMEVAAFAPKDPSAAYDYWKRAAAGEDYEALGNKYRDREFLSSNFMSTDDLDMSDERGEIIPERLADARSFIEKYGDNPSAAIGRIGDDQTKAGYDRHARDKLIEAAELLTTSPYELVRRRDKTPGVMNEEIDLGLANSGGIEAKIQEFQKEAMGKVSIAIDSLRNAGYKPNEIYRRLGVAGFNPEVIEALGVKYTPYKWNKAKQPQPEPQMPKATRAPVQTSPSKFTKVNSQQEYDALESGTPYIDSSGKRAIKK